MNNLDIEIENTLAQIHKLERDLLCAQQYLAGLMAGKKSVTKKFRHGTMMHKVYEILKERKTPIHVEEIIELIGLTKENKASLTGSLATYVRNKKLFNRTAPNTFGLINYDVSNEPLSQSNN